MCENKEMERISFVILISTLMLASLSIVPAHAAEHPTITAASVTLATSIVLTYDENVNVTTIDGAGFALSDGGTVTANSDPEGSDDTITLTVSGITTSDAPVITYIAPPGTVVDAESNPAADQTFDRTTDNAPPTVSSIATAGTLAIDIVLSEDVTINGAAPGDFALSGTISTNPTVTGITAAADTVTPALSSVLDSNDVINLAYDKTTGSIDDIPAPPPPSFVGSFSVDSQNIVPQGLAFSADGYKMFVMDSIFDLVNEYALPKPFTLLPQPNSLASFDARSVTNNIASPRGEIDPSIDTTPPEITAAAVTSLTEILLTYSENIDVTTTDGEGFALSDGGTVSANSDPASTDDTITLTVSGITTASDAPNVIYTESDGSVTDTASNPAEDQTFTDTTPLPDTIPPTITAAAVTSLTEILLTYSENIDVTTTDGEGFALSDGGTVSANSDPASTDDTITLTVSGITTASDAPNVIYTESDGSVTDTASNPAEDQTFTDTTPLPDTIPPTITAAAVTSLTEILLTYSENIDVTTTDGEGFALSDGGTVSANSDPASTDDTITLTVSGITTASDAPNVIYTESDGSVTDTASNPAEDQTFTDTTPLPDTIPPTITAAAVTSLTEILLTYSENIDVTTTDGEGFALSDGGTVSANSDPASTDDTITLTVSGITTASDAPNVIYTESDGSVTDTASNPAEDQTFTDTTPLPDTIPPTITAAAVTSLTEILLTYSENIDVTTTDGEGFALSDGGTVSANSDPASTDDTITLTVSGITTASDAPNVIYTESDGSVTDTASNPAEDQTFTDTTPLPDTIPPTITAAAVTSLTEILLTYSENIDVTTTDGEGFALSDGGTVSANSDPASTDDTITLTVSGITTASDAPNVIYTESDGSVTDTASNPAEDQTFTDTTPLPDTIPPTITAAAVTSLTEILLTYSENIDVTTTDGEGFALSDGGTVSANSDPASTDDTITLTVSGITTASDAPNVIYTESDGSVTDTASNPAEDQTFTDTTPLPDTIPPTITAAAVTSLTEILLTYSENIDVTTTDGEGFALSDGGTVSANSDPASTDDTITLTVSGITTASDAPNVIYTESDGSVTDTASNPAEDQTFTDTTPLPDTIPPTITAAAVTSLTEILLTYSENIDVTTTDGEGFALSDGGTVSANSDPASTDDTITLTVSGITDTSDTPAITYTDSLGTVADTASNPAANQTFTGTTDNAPPTVSSIATAGTSTIDIVLSEDVTINGAAPEDFVLSGTISTDPVVTEITAIAAANTVTLTLNDTLDHDDVILLAYTKTTGSIDDIPAASAFPDGSFSVGSQDTTPNGLAFSANGTSMFVIGSGNDAVHQYALPAPFDISNVTGTSDVSHVARLLVGSQDTTPNGLAFSANGTSMFVIGSVNVAVYQYALPSPFDISNVTGVSNVTLASSFLVGSQDMFPRDVAFSNDGHRMFVVGEQSDAVHQYDLAAPFDVSTASYDDISFSVLSQDNSPRGLAFSNDGTSMFVIGSVNVAVYQYALPAPFDISHVTGISDVSYAGSFPVGSQESSPRGLAFSNDGTRMFVVGSNSDAVHRYALSEQFNLLPQPNSLASFAAISVTNNIAPPVVDDTEKPEPEPERKPEKSGRGGGGGGGRTGVSPSGEPLSNIELYGVSWNCETGLIRIITGDDSSTLSVSVRTSIGGLAEASLSDERIPGSKVFTSHMGPSETYLGILLVDIAGRDSNIRNESISIKQCVGEKTYDGDNNGDMSDTPKKSQSSSSSSSASKGDMECKPGFTLVKNLRDDLACLLDRSVQPLIERGWAESIVG